MVDFLFFFQHNKIKTEAHPASRSSMGFFLIFNYAVTFTTVAVFLLFPDKISDVQVVKKKVISIFLIKVVLFFYCSYLSNDELPACRLCPILGTVVQTE